MQKPLIITFHELSRNLAPLHQWHKRDVDNLHDLWLKGAVMPNSIIRNPAHYDPRLKQPGNYEARIIIHTMLVQWVIDVCNRRGITPEDGQRLVTGRQATIRGEVR